ncbi:MAG TPA: hypothetical protein VK034_28285 [Enhygromyxa sp.]|nr:hypothetical protein [Enhygromyxa sp.]
MPFFEGDLVRFAALALVEHGREDPRAFELGERALGDRLARRRGWLHGCWRRQSRRDRLTDIEN